MHGRAIMLTEMLAYNCIRKVRVAMGSVGLQESSCTTHIDGMLRIGAKPARGQGRRTEQSARSASALGEPHPLDPAVATQTKRQHVRPSPVYFSMSLARHTHEPAQHCCARAVRSVPHTAWTTGSSSAAASAAHARSGRRAGEAVAGHIQVRS